MYKCESQGCSKLVPPHVPQNKIVTETRSQVYENKIKKGKEKGKIKRTEGTEIIEEISVCPKCYENITGKTPAAPRPVNKPEIIVTRRSKDARDHPYKKKQWKNPRRKGRQTDKTAERKKPVVEVVNRLPAKDATK